MLDKAIFTLSGLIVGVLIGMVAYQETQAGQVSRIDKVIGQGSTIQIVGVVENDDCRIVTFIHEGGLYTASYGEGGELLVGEAYCMTSEKNLVPIEYRVKK